MTPIQLAEIEERANMAAEGPWVEVFHEGTNTIRSRYEREIFLAIPTYDMRHNIDFVLNARQDISDLLAEVERLKEENEAQANTLAKWQQTQNEWIEGWTAFYEQWQRVEHEIKMLIEHIAQWTFEADPSRLNCVEDDRQGVPHCWDAWQTYRNMLGLG